MISEKYIDPEIDRVIGLSRDQTRKELKKLLGEETLKKFEERVEILHSLTFEMKYEDQLKYYIDLIRDMFLVGIKVTIKSLAEDDDDNQ